MNAGMLWFDNDPQTDLPAKIDRAAKYYRKKYGEIPNLCFVHPKMVGESKVNGTTLHVETSETILPFHFWIGTATHKEKAD